MCFVLCAFLVPELHFSSDSQMSSLTFVWVASRIVVLFRSSCHYSTERIPFSERNRKRKIKMMIVVKTIVWKRWERVQDHESGIRGGGCTFRQQFLPAIHEQMVRSDLKALFSVDSMSIFLTPSTYYRTSKWISWLDTSLTFSGLPPATLSKHLCVKAADNLNFCYCVISLSHHRMVS